LTFILSKRLCVSTHNLLGVKKGGCYIHLIELKKKNKLKVGTKQSTRAVKEGKAETLFIARDCEQHVVRNIIEEAQNKNIQIVYVDSMKKLGKACGIDVGAATAVIVK
jgi:large subunit ribosomal protein L7A